eukprot:7256944-Alexandrium_andersonii.AAC.1
MSASLVGSEMCIRDSLKALRNQSSLSDAIGQQAKELSSAYESMNSLLDANDFEIGNAVAKMTEIMPTIKAFNLDRVQAAAL